MRRLFIFNFTNLGQDSEQITLPFSVDVGCRAPCPVRVRETGDTLRVGELGLDIQNVGVWAVLRESGEE